MKRFFIWMLPIFLGACGGGAGGGVPTDLSTAPPVLRFEMVRVIGSAGTGAGEFNRPTGLTLDHRGNLYVVDAGNNRLQQFRDGRFVLEFGIFGSAGGQFIEPVKASAAHGFSVVVTDSRNERWQTFDLDGNFLAASLETADERLGIPWGIVRAQDGRLFVTNVQDHTVAVVGLDGAVEFDFGGFGRGRGQLNLPRGIALSGRQTLYVADTGNHRIQIFDVHGGPLGMWGRRGDGRGMFEGPRGVAVDEYGRVYVADTGNHRVQVFDASGVWLSSLLQSDSHGEFLQPGDVAAGHGRLWVADTGRNRVLEFRIIDDTVSH